MGEQAAIQPSTDCNELSHLGWLQMVLLHVGSFPLLNVFHLYLIHAGVSERGLPSADHNSSDMHQAWIRCKTFSQYVRTLFLKEAPLTIRHSDHLHSDPLPAQNTQLLEHSGCVGRAATMAP